MISAESLSKRYRLRHLSHGGLRYRALRDVLTDRARASLGLPRLFARRVWSAFRNPDTPRASHPTATAPADEDFWALKDVSFNVRQGEVLGIIGPNGAGKSTLLKILSRITHPTEGCVRLRGRVASLLEIGTGFHPELTGRENIFLNGGILGMTRAEIRKKFDDIVAFAGVEKFLDTPVKRFSSGMHVRLGFAVAAHLEPEVLVVDEVLAVGDAEFQRKCMKKMRSVGQAGRTVLFVSHNLAAVQALCTRAIRVVSGKLVDDGPVDRVIAAYLAEVGQSATSSLSRPLALGAGLELVRFDLEPAAVAAGARLSFSLELRASQPTRATDIELLLYSASGTRVAVLDLRPCGLPATLPPQQTWHVTGAVPVLRLVEGEYDIGLYIDAGAFHGNALSLLRLTVLPRVAASGPLPHPPAHRGFIDLEFDARLEALRIEEF
jgi:lipopolysaccharide transport system ATP-binding protein